MEFRTLRAFAAVVREGGFSQAAKAIFATQSTVSKAVKQLEDELGVPLLERIGARSELTGAGEIVYRRAQSMLAERDDLIAELDELRWLKRGALRVGLAPLGSNLVFAPLFSAFRRTYPDVELCLVEKGGKQLEDLLLTGQLDLAVTLMPAVDAFDTQRLFDQRLLVLLPASHPLADQGSVDLARLSDMAFILYGEDFQLNDVILAACARRGFKPRVSMRTSQIDLIVELVGLESGIGFLPDILAPAARDADVRLLEMIDGPPDWQLAFAWRRNGYLSSAARAWLALAREIWPLAVEAA